MLEKLESYIERMNNYKRQTTKCLTCRGNQQNVGAHSSIFSPFPSLLPLRDKM